MKEYYFYLDSTPTHSYMKYLHKYPQAAYPYNDLVATNRDRGRGKPEYELLDTGVFDQDRYFDVFVEYAKASPEDMLIQITVHNRGPEPATLQLLPTRWFRNDWSWGEGVDRSTLRQLAQDKTGGVVALSHRDLGERFFFAEGASALLFTENETNTERLVGMPNPFPYVKDGIDNHIVHGQKDAVNPEKKGTKVSAHYPLTLGAGESRTMRLRLSDQPLRGSNRVPYRVGDQEYLVSHLPGESDNAMFGGNSNWRGPVWMPVNMLILRALLQYYLYYGNSFIIECPTGSGKQMNLYGVAEEIGRRLFKIFLQDEQGKRPVHGAFRKCKEDPHWRDYPLFYEYFHGDTGAGVGASHRTGWSGAIARIMHGFASCDAHEIFEQSKEKSAGGTLQTGKKK